MFRLLCISYKLVSVEYYLHKMTNLELDMTAEHISYCARPTWDSARVLAMYITAPYSKQKLNLKKMFPLPWDKDGDLDLAMDEKSFEEQAKKMQDFAKLL